MVRDVVLTAETGLIISEPGTMPDNRLAVAQRHIAEANEKMMAPSMKDNPALMAALVEQCQEAIGSMFVVLGFNTFER